MQKCDAGGGTAAYLCELPRKGVKVKEQELGAQVVARFRLCTRHAENLQRHGAAIHELQGWLEAEPCERDRWDLDHDD
jgi:hypothetical protein